MEVRDIVVGQKYHITGSNGGCMGRCKDCPNFLKGIKVTSIEDWCGERCIAGDSLTNSSNCHFDSRDLTPFKWKDRFK